MGGLGGREEREKWCNYIVSKKTTNINRRTQTVNAINLFCPKGDLAAALFGRMYFDLEREWPKTKSRCTTSILHRSMYLGVRNTLWNVWICIHLRMGGLGLSWLPTGRSPHPPSPLLLRLWLSSQHLPILGLVSCCCHSSPPPLWEATLQVPLLCSPSPLRNGTCYQSLSCWF